MLTTIALALAIAAPSPDFNGDHHVNVIDLLILLDNWGPCRRECQCDLTGTGDVGVGDLLVLLAAWGPYSPCTGDCLMPYASAPRTRNLYALAQRLQHEDCRLMVIGDSINNPEAIGSGTDATDTNTPLFYGRQKSWLPDAWTGAQAAMNQGTRPVNQNGSDGTTAATGTGGGHAFPVRVPDGDEYLYPLLKQHIFSTNQNNNITSNWAILMGTGNYGVPWTDGPVEALLIYKPDPNGVEQWRLVGRRGSTIIEDLSTFDFSGTGPAASYRVNCGSHADEEDRAELRARSTGLGYDESGKLKNILWRGMVRPSATGLFMCAISYGGWGIADHLDNYGDAELADFYQALSVDAAGNRKINTLLIELGQNNFNNSTHKGLMEDLIDKHRDAMIAAGVDANDILVCLVTGADQGEATTNKSNMAILNDQIAQERPYVSHINKFRLMYEAHGEWSEWNEEFTPPGGDNHPNGVGAIEQARIEWEAITAATAAIESPYTLVPAVISNEGTGQDWSVPANAIDGSTSTASGNTWTEPSKWLTIQYESMILPEGMVLDRIEFPIRFGRQSATTINSFTAQIVADGEVLAEVVVDDLPITASGASGHSYADPAFVFEPLATNSAIRAALAASKLYARFRMDATGGGAGISDAGVIEPARLFFSTPIPRFNANAQCIIVPGSDPQESYQPVVRIRPLNSAYTVTVTVGFTDENEDAYRIDATLVDENEQAVDGVSSITVTPGVTTWQDIYEGLTAPGDTTEQPLFAVAMAASLNLDAEVTLGDLRIAVFEFASDGWILGQVECSPGGGLGRALLLGVI